MTNNAAAVSPETLDCLWTEFVELQEVQWYKKFNDKKAATEAKLGRVTINIEAMKVRYQDACNGLGGDACERLNILEKLREDREDLISEIRSYTWNVQRCIKVSELKSYTLLKSYLLNLKGLNERDFDAHVINTLRPGRKKAA